MPPPSKKKDGPSGVWYKLLIVSALLLAFGQLMLHHAQPSSVPAYSSSPKANLIPDEGGALMGPGTDATAGLLQANSALQASLDETKAALRESQGRVQEMGEAARALRVQAETTARAGREKVEPRVQKQDPAVVHAIPTVAVNWPNVGAAALEVAMARADSQGGNGTSKPLLLDDTYTLRPEDCGIILSQRKRVAAMDEDFAFVKYDRGKVAFNKEWSVCDTKQSSVDLVHCLDQWLLRHCRANVLTNAAAALRIGLNPDGGGGAGGSGSSDPAGWAAWVAEVAGAYPALGLVLGVPPSMPPPRSAAGPQRISGVGGGRYFFLAACLHNNAPLLKSGYVENLVALARHLRATGGRAAGAAVGGWPRNRVFVSIYENDSTDGTGKELERLRGALTGAGVEHAVVSEKRGAAVEPDRIDKLSFARGRALAPLLAQHAAGTDNAAGVTGGGGDGGYDGDGGGDDDDDDDGDGRWVVFLNDIGFHWQDVAELVATPVAYDMACGMDFQAGEGVELYDVWVNRDLDGKPVARQAPHFSHPLDKDLLNRGLPVPVSCCWNGAVVVRAKVFTDPAPPPASADSAAATASGAAGPVVFRRAVNQEEGSCDESECTTFCRDLWDRGLARIYVNPKVWWGYSYGASRSVSSARGATTLASAMSGYSTAEGVTLDATGTATGAAIATGSSGTSGGTSSSTSSGTRGTSSGTSLGGDGGETALVLAARPPEPLAPVVLLLLAAARSDRLPLGMGCCSLHSGANFAPKLGLFVGCHHQRQSISARSHMHAAALRLKSRLALAVSVPPVPSLFPLQLFGAPGGAGGAGGGGSGGGGEKRRRRRKKADGDAVFAVASFASPGGGNVAAASGIATAAAPTAADARSPLPAPSDLTSEAAHVFNRRATCRTVFPALTQRFEPKSLGAVVDVSDEAHGAATGTAVSVRRLVTREDVWMAAPLAAALPLFRDSGVCAEERYTYRLGVGTAARPSYGKDMLLVSDRYQFVCVVIWKVASRTLLKALEGPLEGGGLGAVRVEGHRLTPQQRGYTTFTFVRDPLARFVSGYFSAMKWTKMKRHALCAKKLAEVHAASADAPPNGAATCDDKGQKSGGGSDGGGGGGGGGGDDPDGCSGGSGGDDLSFLHDGDIDQSAEMAGHPGEPARFLRFTRRLVGSGQGTGVAFPGVQHVFTQASFLSVTDAAGEPLFPRLDFIGKLEHFEDDWQRLEALLATRPHAPRLPPRPRTPHRNPTPGELSALLREALGNRTALLKQVCAFYTQDYMCFGYKSPPGCEPPPKMAKK